MKTLQEQYNLIKEGKGHKDVFMKSALRQFPNLFNNLTDFPTAVKVLKQKSILSEGIGGVVTQNTSNPFANWANFLAEEVKAVEKEPTKEVVDMETAGFDYKDPKNIDNLYGEQFLKGYYAEMKDPKNADKDVAELKEIVAKNLEKDRNFYVKNAAFGVKGIGYTEDAPGLAVSDKEIKGKYASSGMEEVKLKEGVMVNLKDLLNETLSGYVNLQPLNIPTPVQEDARTDAEEEGYLDGMRDEKEDLEDKAKKAAPKKKVKKETVDSKLAEIEKAGKITTLEAQIEAIDEAIDTKNHRISMVTEDDNLSELVDKAKMKEMQREVKDLEKRKAQMEKLYEKMCGKAYSKPEMVDEVSEEYED
jgi:hypothetical protein